MVAVAVLVSLVVLAAAAAALAARLIDVPAERRSADKVARTMLMLIRHRQTLIVPWVTETFPYWRGAIAVPEFSHDEPFSRWLDDSFVMERTAC